jgi:hypothetical protein
MGGRVMKRALVIVTFAVLLTGRAAADQPHYFMLLEPGNERCYCGHYGLMYCETVTGYDDDVSIVEVETFYPIHDIHEERWLMDDEGDVWALPPAEDPDGIAELWLDVPLTPGKSWRTDFDPYGTEYRIFTVAGSELISTPVGPRWAIVVTMEWATSGTVIHGRYSYVEHLGLVAYDWTAFDFHFTMCDVIVGTAPRSWSQIKSRYR